MAQKAIYIKHIAKGIYSASGTYPNVKIFAFQVEVVKIILIK